MTKLYIYFLIDLIEIQSHLKEDEKNIISKYKNLIQNQLINNNNNNDINQFKKELECLKLDKLNIYKDSNKIGKYGWCIFCKKSSNNWNLMLNFPVCNEKNCERILRNFLSNELYYINDFFEMILFLSKIKINNIKTIELCIDTIKEMLTFGIKSFKKEKRMIEAIKEIMKDFVIKNSQSQNIKIFQSSLDLFNIIFINFRPYLKEQTESFFMKIFISYLESEKILFNYKDIILNNLYFLLDNIGPNFLIEIYINYDLNSNLNALFCVLINLFTKVINGLYQQNKYSKTFNGTEEISVIVIKIYELLSKFILLLNDLFNEKAAKNMNRIKDNNQPNDELITYLVIFSFWF